MSKEITQVPVKGLYRDCSLSVQPENTYRYALNGVNDGFEEGKGFISNEFSNQAIEELPDGAILIGSVYIGDNKRLIFLDIANISEIGIFDEKDIYTTVIRTTVLKFSQKFPIKAEFRMRKNNNRIIYFTDGNNKPRSLNLDKLENHYSIEYREWLDLGKDSNSFIGEKWKEASFDLIKSYRKIPSFNGVEILPIGDIKPGSYSFGVIYVDEDLNNSNVVTVSNPINIYNDSTNSEYGTIRGSRNIESALMSYGSSDKAIKITIGNLDTNYPFYRICIIQANTMTGISNNALLSEIISINQSEYIYYGNDETLTQIPLESINIDKMDIDKVSYMKQLDNRLILLNYKTKNINYTKFQQNASKIRSHLTVKKVYLNSIKGIGNPKDPTAPFDAIGYMPGEVYSFGIVYIFDDGTMSPVYHIPGRNKNELREAVNGFNDNMDYYETPNSKYPEIHSYINRNQYWGKDSYGSYLTGTPKRHHKFPSRKSRRLALYEKETTPIAINKYKLKININFRAGQTYPTNIITNEPIIISVNIKYRKKDSTGYNEYNTLITGNITKELFVETVYEGDSELESIDGGAKGIVFGEIESYFDKFDITFDYDVEVQEILNPAYYTNIYGIRFDNIEKPHENVVGYFIVRNERLESDKIVIDNALFGPLTKYDYNNTNYRVFNKWVNVSSGEEVEGVERNIDSNSLYFFSPEHQYKGSTINFNHINIQGYFDTVKMTSINNGEPPDTSNYATRPYSVIIPDSMEGTSYNSEIHASADEDGFNLIVGYRNSNLTYHNLDVDINWSYDSNGETTIEKIMYIGASDSKFYNGKTYYNACMDNKIGIVKFQDNTNIFSNDRDRELLFGTTNTRLYYGTLISNNESAYNNFMDRDYYKEHNNPVYFMSDGIGNTVDIFNGDAYVNASTLVASTYYGMKMANRKKKDKKCSGILGVALIIVGVVATVLTAGAAFGLVSAALGVAGATVGALSLGAAASMLKADLKLEALKKMLNEDYPNGLEYAISDKDISDDADNEYPYGCGLKNGTAGTDDSIAWFADRLTDLILESSTNIGLRTSLTSTGIDFINSFSNIQQPLYNLRDGIKITVNRYVDMTGFDENQFRAYLTEKLTIIDGEKGAGRLYRGYATAEWYDINPDHNKRNTEKLFIHLPSTYDGKGIEDDFSQKYVNRAYYSQQSFQEEITDNYRSFLPNNYKDINGEYGAITGAFVINNRLFIHTSNGLFTLPSNIQEKITDQLTTYIGTGEFFSIDPQKISSGVINYGSQADFSTIEVEGGIVFIDQNNSAIYFKSEKGIEELTDKGMRIWFDDNLPLNIKSQLYNLIEYQWRINNPTVGSGIHTGYDNKLNRLLVTKKDYEFTKESVFVGEFSNDITNYKVGDIFVKENFFHVVSTATYKKIRDIPFTDFEIDSNIIISNIDFDYSKKYNNIVTRWFNKSSLNYKTVDHSSLNYIESNDDSIYWPDLSVKRSDSLNSIYINGYITCNFIPTETEEYTFYIRNNDGIKMWIEYVNNNTVISELIIDSWTDGDVSTKIGKKTLTANTEYTVKIDFYQAIAKTLIAGITPVSENGGSVERYDVGTVLYTPVNNFEGLDTFEILTDKNTYSNIKSEIAIIVKDMIGEEETFPYVSGVILDNDTPIYHKILNFPVTMDGILRIRDRITIPHIITINYEGVQNSTIDYSTLWNIDKNETILIPISYLEDSNVITVTIEGYWKSPYGNEEYINEVNYEIAYL